MEKSSREKMGAIWAQLKLYIWSETSLLEWLSVKSSGSENGWERLCAERVRGTARKPVR